MIFHWLLFQPKSLKFGTARQNFQKTSGSKLTRRLWIWKFIVNLVNRVSNFVMIMTTLKPAEFSRQGDPLSPARSPWNGFLFPTELCLWQILIDLRNSPVFMQLYVLYFW